MSTAVTEADFRLPEFRDAKAEDYERREDGRIVRKDRWETAVRSIAAALRMNSFEVEDVPSKVRQLKSLWWELPSADKLDGILRDGQYVDVKLDNGKLISCAKYVGEGQFTDDAIDGKVVAFRLEQ